MKKVRNFNEMKMRQFAAGKFVCLGLDLDISKIPKCVTDEYPTTTQSMFIFGQSIVDETKDIVGFYKPNLAFFSKYGDRGAAILRELIQYINKVAPDVPVILDAKYSEIDNSNLGYVDTAFDYYAADAVTINPYFGHEAMKPFLDCKDKGIIILCRTSNVGAGRNQDAIQPCGLPLYLKILRDVIDFWNYNENCMAVFGATNPDQLAAGRKIAGDKIDFLVPGVGAQGGDINEVLFHGLNDKKNGLIINLSRAILYASSGADYALAARAETQRVHNIIISYIRKLITEADYIK